MYIHQITATTVGQSSEKNPIQITGPEGQTQAEQEHKQIDLDQDQSLDQEQQTTEQT